LTTIINPIALFVYLAPVRQDLSEKDFFIVLFKATIISLTINLFFTFSGEYLFTDLLKINFNSFRVFGGIVLLSIALISIVQGKKALIAFRGSLDDLASEIALPFMTGVGTISICVLVGSKYPPTSSLIINTASLAITYVTIFILFWARYHINSKKWNTAFDKVLVTFIRINAFILGAFGVDMIRVGIINFSKTI